MVAKAKPKMVRTLRIDRAKWLRGDANTSMLLNPKGKMCCLGFYSLKLGLTEEDIYECKDPDVVGLSNFYPSWLFQSSTPASGNTEACNELMLVNDDETLTDAKRERQIHKLFARQGVKVTFFGKTKVEE